MPSESRPHPDDRTVTAVLDGEASAEETAHVSGCDECQARLAELRAVARVVAASVPMTREESREAAIAAALRALPSRSSSRAQWRRRSRRTWLAPALATAAVLVAITVAVSLVNAGRHTSNRASTAAGAAPQVTVGSIVQMGAIDEAGLKAAVTAASERSPADRSASGSAGPSSALGSYGAVSPKAAPITTDDATVIERCDSQLRRSGSPGDRRTFVGVGSWSGTPAVVIAFTSGSDHTNVYVMSRAACEILHFQRFSA